MLISTTQLISQSWKIYFRNFKTLMSFIGIQILLVIVAFGVPGGLFYLASKTSSGFLMILGIISYVLGICASVYGGLWINVATSKAAKNAIENKAMSVLDVFKKTRSLILPTFGTTLLKVALVYLGLIAGDHLWRLEWQWSSKNRQSLRRRRFIRVDSKWVKDTGPGSVVYIRYFDHATAEAIKKRGSNVIKKLVEAFLADRLRRNA
jgi:hypothetical protein